MASSIVFVEGEEGWTVLYGIKTSNTIPFHLVMNWNNNTIGPSHCETCRTDGTFEGVFYGLCGECCARSERCTCVYCHVAKKDGHNHIERRTNMGKFIKTIQLVIDDLRRDYPVDEYGIVKDGIESGFYILTLHTQCQYEKMQSETVLPLEVTQLSIGELNFRWNPAMTVTETVCEAALKAAERTGILEWVQELWGIPAKKEKVVWHSDHCDLNAVNIDWRGIPYCCPFDLWHKEKIEQQEQDQQEHDIQELKADADANAGDDLYDFDVQCAECETWISAKETDNRDYCRDCQNPEYDPVWPMGD